MKKQKRPLTLLEIMIVIFLIGLIGSVVGYNMKGSIDEGRYFKTEQAAAQIRDILLLEVAKGESTVDEVVGNPLFYLKKAKVMKEPEKMLKDGWGTKFEITKNKQTDIKVTTDRYEREKAKKRKKANGEEVKEVEVQDDDE